MAAKPPALVRHPVNISGMYERLTETMDALLEQKITPEHGNAIANIAEKVALFAKLEIASLMVV